MVSGGNVEAASYIGAALVFLLADLSSAVRRIFLATLSSLDFYENETGDSDKALMNRGYTGSDENNGVSPLFS
jgi:hypothetical protein